MCGLGGRRSRGDFWAKLLAATTLAAIADTLFFAHRIGSGLAGFALAWLALAIVVRPAMLRGRHAPWLLLTAVFAALLLADRPTAIGWGLFWTALTAAALSPRMGRVVTLPDWARRIMVHAVLSPGGPVADVLRLNRLTPDSRPFVERLARAMVLPIFGGALFLWLFFLANPLIASALAGIRLPLADPTTCARIMFWLVVLTTVWAVMRPMRRPHAWRKSKAVADQDGLLRALDGRIGSPAPALLVFNVLFAVENGLDLTFLWSGAPLPAGMTLADYAHRGAYPLILTALLAGAFSLFVLREGSPGAKSQLIRGLVGLWVAQNVLLSASSMLRTLDYVQAYSLTRLRLAALLWMGLVMLGLMLIGWRMLRGKSAAWLVEANVLALVVVLIAADLCDLGAVAAWWNVSHAREVGGAGAQLDLCYLRKLGPAALLPVVELEHKPIGPVLRRQALFVREAALDRLTQRQADWHGWTWRGAARLSSAQDRLRGVNSGPGSDPCMIAGGGATPATGLPSPNPAPSSAAPLATLPLGAKS